MTFMLVLTSRMFNFGRKVKSWKKVGRGLFHNFMEIQNRIKEMEER